MADEMGAVERRENPLVPNAKLRQMYVAMVQARMVEQRCEGMAKRRGSGVRLQLMRGEEAVRASTVVQMASGDLVSDGTDTIGMEYMLGSKLGPLLEHVRASLTKRGAGGKGYADGAVIRRRLPQAGNVAEQMALAVGAAAALKGREGERSAVIAYVRAERRDEASVEGAARMAAEHELPLLIVLLPGAKEAAWSTRSAELGLPILPVDVEDALALYRVVQESLGRARAGDGPAMLQCVRFRPEGRGHAAEGDGLERMRELLVGRGIAKERWVSGVEETFARRIARV